MKIAGMMRVTAAAALFAGLGTADALAQATQVPGLKLTGNSPIQIESDKFDVDENGGKATFTGNVTVVQGDTQMKTARMIVYYDKAAAGGKGSGQSGATAMAGAGSDAIDHLEVDGGVYLKNGTQQATGDAGNFDMKAQVLHLTGTKVVLSDGPNVLTGCKLTVQMKTGMSNLEGCGGRVKVLMQPGSQPAQ